jgi:hypothetical protein
MDDCPNSRLRSAAGTAICTLFEGDYHIGLAALINSLIRAGFVGGVWAGYRGVLPTWLNQLQRTPDRRKYLVADKIQLTFIPLETKLHFTNYKPQFMLDLLSGPARDCTYLWYFDPDIFIRCNWSFFAEWQQHGIALCQEIVNNILPADSPLRHQWMRTAASIGLSNPKSLNHYFSGGMVGISSAHRSFLYTWLRVLKRAELDGWDPTIFRGDEWGREMSFFASDQDALNVAAMYSEHPLTTMGPESMGFVSGGFTMYHAVGAKPWRHSLLLKAIAGFPPTNATKFFFSQLSSPIRVYSPLHLGAKRVGCLIAAFIGRFYARR